MKILALLASSYFSGVAISQGAVVQVPVRLSPFGGSQTIAIVDNAGSVISVGVQRRCTRDLPVSFCSTSSVISGGAKVEFLRSGVNT